MEDNRSYESLVGGGFDGSIFEHIVSVENLFSAWREFKKGKTKKPDVIEFALNLEDNIFALRYELILGKWICGGYVKFSIKDPKPRIIHKATVRDRVLYQAVYRVLYPIFDKTFIHDVYSSRKEKGTHAGIKRLNVFLRKLSSNYNKPVYALRCDIKKFFDSIDHEVLINLLKHKIDCTETLSLLEKIIDSFHKTPGKGLPLGNVTSQIFANIYMNSFDWYVKRELNAKYYIRYCDDFVLASCDKDVLLNNIRHMDHFLSENLKLTLHSNKIEIRKLRQGIDFLGVVLLPYRIVTRTKTKTRIVKKSARLLLEFQAGNITKDKLSQSISSYLGHMGHTKSRKTKYFLHMVRAKT